MHKIFFVLLLALVSPAHAETIALDRQISAMATELNKYAFVADLIPSDLKSEKSSDAKALSILKKRFATTKMPYFHAFGNMLVARDSSGTATHFMILKLAPIEMLVEGVSSFDTSLSDVVDSVPADTAKHVLFRLLMPDANAKVHRGQIAAGAAAGYAATRIYDHYNQGTQQQQESQTFVYESSSTESQVPEIKLTSAQIKANERAKAKADAEVQEQTINDQAAYEAVHRPNGSKCTAADNRAVFPDVSLTFRHASGLKIIDVKPLAPGATFLELRSGPSGDTSFACQKSTCTKNENGNLSSDKFATPEHRAAQALASKLQKQLETALNLYDQYSKGRVEATAAELQTPAVIDELVKKYLYARSKDTWLSKLLNHVMTKYEFADLCQNPQLSSAGYGDEAKFMTIPANDRVAASLIVAKVRDLNTAFLKNGNATYPKVAAVIKAIQKELGSVAASRNEDGRIWLPSDGGGGLVPEPFRTRNREIDNAKSVINMVQTADFDTFRMKESLESVSEYVDCCESSRCRLKYAQIVKESRALNQNTPVSSSAVK